MTNRKPLLVVLDIDETLIHSGFSEERYGPCDFKTDAYYTYKRPNVEGFLSWLANDKRFEMAIFTAATDDYADEILHNLGVDKSNLKARLYRKSLITRASSSIYGMSETTYIKDLKKISRQAGWPLERLVAVDDRPDLYERQYSNVLAVPAFYPGQEQSASHVFNELKVMLLRLHKMENIRPMEKRGWLKNLRQEMVERQAPDRKND